MSERRLLITTVIIGAVILGRTDSGRAPNFSIGPRYSPTRTWAFFLLPGSMWGRVGSQTKQNVQGRPGQDSGASLVNDADSRSLYKDKSRDEQADKSQSPPSQNDTKPPVHKNTLLHFTWVIIAIILLIVLSVVAVYYWVLFYPILCKKERKYDVMQMSAKP